MKVMRNGEENVTGEEKERKKKRTKDVPTEVASE